MGQEIIKLPKPLVFEWDKGNERKNWFKHEVSQVEAETAFVDKDKILLIDVLHTNKQERRYILLGTTNTGRQLFVAFTIRGEKVRVISARDMARKERGVYQETSETT